MGNTTGILSFLGTGSAFNRKFGNTSAFYFCEKENHLFLIDCGENIFERLLSTDILKRAESIDVLITHLHSDHIGSLASLIFYCRYVKNIIPNIIYPDFKTIYEYLSIVGVPYQFYDLNEPCDYKRYSIQYIKQSHSPIIKSYGYVITINNQKLFYSGDGKSIPEKIMLDFYSNHFNYFYQDVTRFESENHMHINTLAAAILPFQRNLVYCMHFDDNDTVELARSYGFNVAIPRKFNNKKK